MKCAFRQGWIFEHFLQADVRWYLLKINIVETLSLSVCLSAYLEFYPNSNKVMQFTYQLQNAAPQMVQKHTVAERNKQKNQRFGL